MRVLHLASFNGNIGDIANHKGFYNMCYRYVSKNIDFEPLEMREFYKNWNLRKYDDELIKYINTFDAFVVGGGNFFDVKWDYSCSGTTFNMSKEMMDKITCPIIFNCVGIDISDSISSEVCLERFAEFFEYISQKDNIVVSVRNDDSKKLISEYIGQEAANSIYVIPDEGFFTVAKEYYHPELPDDKKIIAVNTAKDRIYERWDNKEFDYDMYCEELAQYISKCMNENDGYHFVFVPHIPGDIEASYDVIKKIDDKIVRRGITVSPYLNGLNTSGDYIVDLYRKCDLTIGMRYHSNICSIAMHTPALAIFTLQKHVELYKNIGFENRIVSVSEHPFHNELNSRMQEIIDNREEYVKENKKTIELLSKDIMPYLQHIKKIFDLQEEK